MRRAVWIPAVALVVLAARAFAYALAPSPLARMLEHQAGGPRLPVVVATTLAAGLILAVIVVSLAGLGVRERALIEGTQAPPLRLRRLAVRAPALFAASVAGFAGLESYLHWRAGLGWHGLHCLVGPAHRNALPILAALSLLAAALATAVEHVVRWMRRMLAAIAARVKPLPLDCLFFPAGFEQPAAVAVSPGARGPPVRVS